jgi:uncharacterized protein YbgA (DUF1722 family)
MCTYLDLRSLSNHRLMNKRIVDTRRRCKYLLRLQQPGFRHLDYLVMSRENCQFASLTIQVGVNNSKTHIQ